MCENCANISSALTSLSVEIHDMANINVIDPDGDVIFICGEIELQVSSKVLSLASPVFKALFSPNFAEGQPTSSKAIHIHLHDDDAESLRFLCAILHHKCASTNGIGLERLEKLAVVTDKYDVCMFPSSIRPNGHVVLVTKRMLGVVGARRPLNPSDFFCTAAHCHDEDTLSQVFPQCVRAMYYWAKCEIYNTKHTKEPSRLLWPAYAFEEAQFFNSLTKFMMLNLPNDGKARNASTKYSIPEDIESHIPEGLLGRSSEAPLASKKSLRLTLSKRPYSLLNETSRENCKFKLSKSSALLQKNARRATSS